MLVKQGVDHSVLVGDALQVERDSDAIRRRGAPEVVEDGGRLHLLIIKYS